MTCSKFGCDLEVNPKPDGTGMECPKHGAVIPIIHENQIDRRWAQAQLEIQEGVRNGRV